MKIVARTIEGLKYLHNKANPVQGKPTYDILRIQVLVLVDEGFYPNLFDFGLVSLRSIGVVLFELIIRQKSFNNTKVVVYFIFKVGMVAFIM